MQDKKRKNLLHPASFTSFLRAGLPWLLTAGGAALLLLEYWFYGKQWLNGDISALMVKAAQMNEAGTLLPPQDWWYSTSLGLFGAWPFQLGLALCRDWHAARTLALAVFLALELACCLYFARAAGLGRHSPWLCLVIVCSFGSHPAPNVSDYFHFVQGGMMYLYEVLQPFLLGGLALRLAAAPLSCARRAGLAAAFCLLCFAFGADNLRILMTFSFPLAAAALLLALTSSRKPESARLWWLRTLEGRALLVSAAGLAAALSGYLLNSRVLKHLYSFRDYGQSTLAEFSLASFEKTFNNTVSLLGYRAGEPVFSLAGIASLAAVLLLFLAALSVAAALRLWQELPERDRLVLLLSWMLFLVSFVMVSLTGQNGDLNYMIPGVLFLFPPMLLAWKRTRFAAPWQRVAWFSAGAVSLLFLNLWMVRPAGGAVRGALLGGEASNHWQPASTPLSRAAEWLADNGYRNGYASFWNASTAQELSSGVLDIWATDGLAEEGKVWQQLPVYRWLQSARHAQPPTGTVFVLLGDNEVAEAQASAYPFAVTEKLVYAQDGLNVFAYESDAELQYYIYRLTPGQP